jgi:predicted Rossmann fold nucleotide-binding protein DprA/Smf involved in DNA uptake
VTSAVVISGSRQTTHQPSTVYEDLFAEFLGPFVASSDVKVFVGGAKGIDSLALTWLVEHTTANVVVAVPGTIPGQPEEAQTAITNALLSGRVEVVELAHPDFPSAEAYHARNRWMVDRSHLLVAFPHGTSPTSGTWYTINYTAQQGKPHLIVPI